MLRKYSYKFGKGPLSKEGLIKDRFTEGDCRLAVQYYLFNVHNVYLNPGDVLNPRAYKEVGTFVIKEGSFDINLLNSLNDGDIIYAERIKDKNGKFIDKSKSAFSTRDEWIIHLHTAIYTKDSKIYHSSLISKGSAEWDINTFTKYYKVIAVKRI